MRTEFDFNERYLTKDKKPWFPIMGEMHYTRFPKRDWKESLYKMKAGGVNVASTYVIWIHHEEIENEFDFSSNRDLRAFVKLCGECGLYMFLRIGPWIHGEVRNGGFPDWLMKKGYELRSNDPGYLAEVRKFYQKIYQQVEGLLYKDGGPIIGVQIENELGHCGGAYGEEGEAHMRTLYQMAKDVGFEVPYYTATGWGGAVTGGLLPVMGGYAEAPWDQRLTEIEPSGNYVFTYERNDHNIGSDFGLGVGVTFDYNKFPYLTAELGGGMQVTHHRRPVAEAEDIGAMSLVKLGSGVNLLGYYMYHGGTNPKGKLTTLQESRETGYLNDVPELSYDFRAPIREYGQISETYKEIKLFAMFAKDFGLELCDMPAYIPEDNPLDPMNFTDLRYSVRHNGKQGYIFVNNYVRRYAMAEHAKAHLSVQLPNEEISFPEITVKDKDYYFFPFNMKLGNAVLKTALASPLCILKNVTDTYVFYSDFDPQYEILGDLGDVKIITISREEAKNAWKVYLGREHLIISNSNIIQTDQGLTVIGRSEPRLKVYPDFDKVPQGWTKAGKEGEFVIYEQNIDLDLAEVDVKLIDETQEKKVYELEIKSREIAIDYFLQVTYQGDQAKLYLEDEMIADHFFTGKDWEISLERFDFPKKLRLEIYPLYEDAKIFLEKWPVMTKGVACELTKVVTETEYKTIITF
ncbi:MAG: beta-galactosidase [Clostridiales bacterium]|nr:beta-galactosidase [Clostridiales bacterium]